jgi:3-hydroxyisobutyrate dehydrogenase
MEIGIIGTGRMGAAIAGRLLGLGHKVAVWNRTLAKARPLADSGAAVRVTPSALVRECDLIISMLTDAKAIDAAYGGPAGAIEGAAPGKLFIEMSTVRPEAEVALEARVRAKGAALVDCPVGGSVGPAKEGKLFGFVGGAEADVARARPVLEQICRRVEHVGPVGAGARMKLAINLPLLVYWQALAEALSLAQPLGIAPERMIDILSDTSGGPNMLKARGPVIAATLNGKETTPVTVSVETMRKDLAEMVEEARTLGRALPLTARTLECYDDAIREGWGASDVTMLPARWLRRR